MEISYNLDDYDYFLPKELIAQSSVHPKSFSKLLVIDKDGSLYDKRFYNIKDYLKPNDVVVINISKVKRAKLKAHKITGKKAEIILMRRINNTDFFCRIKGKIKKGNELVIDSAYKSSDELKIKVIDKVDDIYKIRFNKPINDAEIKNISKLPTPPYIKNEVYDKDYQTVYSKKEGSLAAPTAGLHWTKNLIRELKRRGVVFAEVVLDVGFGTFLPIKDKDFRKHKMEPEYVIINQKNADIINNRKGRLFVVGTTTLKALETSADSSGRIKPFEGYSNLFIYPGYKFKIKLDGFITNFHLPKSTLILLVSALVGKDKVLNSYKYAVSKKYRFFSLGDACLFIL